MVSILIGICQAAVVHGALTLSLASRFEKGSLWVASTLRDCEMPQLSVRESGLKPWSTWWCQLLASTLISNPQNPASQGTQFLKPKPETRLSPQLFGCEIFKQFAAILAGGGHLNPPAFATA